MYSANESASQLELVAESEAQAGNIHDNGYLILLQEQDSPGRFSKSGCTLPSQQTITDN